MKKYKNIFPALYRIVFVATFALCSGNLFAQDVAEAPAPQKTKPVKNSFGSVWLIDNQTVIVPVKGTFEMDIHHRFGTINKGRKDVWGLFAPSNIRFGVNYAPINKLYVGAGLTKERMQIDFNAKYALLQQTTDNKMPVSVSYFGNVVIDARDKSYFNYFDHRMSYFHQVIIARKFSNKFSAQVAPSLSWYNNVEAFLTKEGTVQKKMKNEHFAVAVLGRFKITEKTAIIAGYDQPITQHPMNNPHPNISLGIETTTSSHAFQVFFSNYYNIVPQSNNVFNQNDYRDGQFVIGFNITRLWNF